MLIILYTMHAPEKKGVNALIIIRQHSIYNSNFLNKVNYLKMVDLNGIL